MEFLSCKILWFFGLFLDLGESNPTRENVLTIMILDSAVKNKLLGFYDSKKTASLKCEKMAGQ